MHNNSQAIEEAATEWVARIDRGLDRAEERALEDWLASDQQCRDALNVAQAVWKNLDRAQVFKIAVEQGHQEKVARRSYQPFAYAAGLALLAVTAATTWRSYVRTHESTRTGEIRQVPLEDGSRVTLDTRTRIVIDYGSRARIVRLEAGEALFEVAKDPTRPFVVQTGNIKVEAIGTAFVVRKASDSEIDVTVTKGAVDVWSSERPLESVVRVKAGSSTSLKGAGAIAPPQDLTARQIEQATDWTSGTLDLDGTTLAQAAAQINRYNTRQVLIADRRLAAETLVGHVSTADPLAFAEAAAAMLDATVRTDGNQILLEPASGAVEK
jgi:transmembrane sensor